MSKELSIQIGNHLVLHFENDQEFIKHRYKVRSQFLNEIYADSWALIIGINDYQNVEPLTYATPDAESVQELFLNKLETK